MPRLQQHIRLALLVDLPEGTPAQHCYGKWSEVAAARKGNRWQLRDSVQQVREEWILGYYYFA